jgi:RimJ/RimL family protein N-acetyltransferase
MSPESHQTRSIATVLADPVWAQDRLEIGWALLSPFRGRGLATEIGAEGLRFANEVLGTSRVVAFTERHNYASRRAMERLGLSLRGEICSIGLIEGDDSVHEDALFAVYAAAE